MGGIHECRKVADGCLWGLVPQSDPCQYAQLVHRLLSANIGSAAPTKSGHKSNLLKAVVWLGS
jgi:hypothetical protein